MARSVAVPSAALVLACLAAAPVPAAVFTVGPDGAHATIAAAITAAEADPGASHEIRLQAHGFGQTPTIVYAGDKSFDISGGWDMGFTTQSDDPEATSFFPLPGNDTRILDMYITGGHIELSNLTLRDAQTSGDSAGVRVVAEGSGHVVLRDCIVRDNHASVAGNAVGGGIYAVAFEDGQLEIRRCVVRDNSIEAGGLARSAGIHATADNNARLVVSDNHIEGNSLLALPGSTTPYMELDSAGTRIDAYDNTTAEINGNRIIDNTLDARGNAAVHTFATAVHIGAAHDAAVIARGNVIRANTSNATQHERAHVVLAVGANANLDFGDSEITQGGGTRSGLFLFSYGDTADNTSQLHVTNVTVADNNGTGVRGNDRFPVTTLGSFFNNIVAGNDTASVLPAWMTQGANLLDMPVTFAASEAGNYALAAGSPGIDAGNNTPPGGLGSSDAAGGTRIRGARVDQGAYEFGVPVLFADSFE